MTYAQQKQFEKLRDKVTEAHKAFNGSCAKLGSKEREKLEKSLQKAIARQEAYMDKYL